MDPTTNPLVSIIIPIYQSARYLGETLQSVEKQTTFKKNPNSIEILLIVDGECENFDSKIPATIQPILKVHRIQHCGVSAARNYGIQKAKGTLGVAFLDADDIWLEEKLEKQIQILKDNPQVGMCYTNSYWIDKTGQVLHRTQEQQYGGLPEGQIFKRMLERDWLITSSVLIRKEVFDKVGLFDTKLEVCEDWEFKIRVSKEFETRAVKEPMIQYRLHVGGSHYKCERMLECGYQVFDKHIKEAFKNENANGTLNKLKANISLNLAGSWLYIDKTTEARKYMSESMKYNKTNLRLYLMFILSLLPKWMRDLLLTLRDRVPILP